MSFNDIAISVKDLSKCFQIYNEPRDRLKQFVLPRVQRSLGLESKQYFQEFWALKDISFEVKRGETVGIIGRNGSGKSTLLQIICGTLTPSGGKVETNGRVAALLELGSGFNPEFTGYENIYLYAAVLGLSRDEVDERYEDIVSFAEIGDFIQQPVKTYSSGMAVRLAFAVIAHVDADILIVDEALAVGDAVFTQRCMRFIRDFQKRGTLLFVSHDMGAVQNLCEKSIWLDKGVQRLIGPSEEVSKKYLQSSLQDEYGEDVKLESVGESEATIELDIKKSENNLVQGSGSYGEYSVNDNLDSADGWNTGSAEIISVSLENLKVQEVERTFNGGERVQMMIQAKAYTELHNPILGFIVKDRLGQDLFGENTLPFTDKSPVSVKAGQSFSGRFIFTLPMLSNGEYSVMTSIADGHLYEHVQHHYLHDALIINVSSAKTRWGLVGIPFEKVVLDIEDE